MGRERVRRGTLRTQVGTHPKPTIRGTPTSMNTGRVREGRELLSWGRRGQTAVRQYMKFFGQKRTSELSASVFDHNSHAPHASRPRPFSVRWILPVFCIVTRTVPPEGRWGAPTVCGPGFCRLPTLNLVLYIHIILPSVVPLTCITA